MSVILVAPPALWRVARTAEAGRISGFELETRTTGGTSSTLPGENLALASIEASLVERCIPVQFVNGQAGGHLSVEHTFGEVVQAAKVGGSPTLVGFTGTVELLDENRTLARMVKDRWSGARTVLGHDFATLNAERILASFDEFDYVVRSEGEQAMGDLAEACASGASVDHIGGLVHRSTEGRITFNPLGPPLDLGALPWCSRRDLPSVLAIGMSAGIFTSRGCPFRCTYCTTGASASLHPGAGSYRTRPVSNVVDEIEMLIKNHSIPHLTIVDDLFVHRNPASFARVHEFCDEMTRRGIRIPMLIDARIDSIERVLFERLRAVGVEQVFIGIETADDQRLAEYGKLYVRRGASQFDRIRERLAILEDMGISVIPGLITYHAEVTKRELQASARLIDTLGYRFPHGYWRKVDAYPGTPLYESYEAKSLLAGPWPDTAWRFADPWAEAHYRRVRAAKDLDRYDADHIRRVFLEGLED